MTSSDPCKLQSPVQDRSGIGIHACDLQENVNAIQISARDPSNVAVASSSSSPPTREVLKAVAPRAMAASDRWLRAPWARGSGPAHWSSRTLVVLAVWLFWLSGCSGFSGFPRLFSIVAHVANSHISKGRKSNTTPAKMPDASCGVEAHQGALQVKAHSRLNCLCLSPVSAKTQRR